MSGNSNTNVQHWAGMVPVPRLDILIEGKPAVLSPMIKDGRGLIFWFAVKPKGHGWIKFDVRKLGADERSWIEIRRGRSEEAVLSGVTALLAGTTVAEIVAARR